MPAEAAFSEKQHQVLTEHVVALEAQALSARAASDGKSVVMEKKQITAVPYYVWANRGANAMLVWLPTKIKSVKLNDESKHEDGGNY